MASLINTTTYLYFKTNLHNMNGRSLGFYDGGMATSAHTIVIKGPIPL